MPVAKVQLPDGRIARFDVPDGTTPQQVESFAHENFAKGAFAAAPDPVTEAINKSPTAGVVDAAGGLVSGALAAPTAGLAGLVQGAKNVLAPVTGQEPGMPAGDRVKQVQDALTYEPRTTIGKGITKAVSYPFEKLANVADTAGAATADATKSPMAGAAVNTAFQSIPLVLGRVAPVGEGAAAVAKRNAARLKNEQVDAGTTQAKEAGYKLPPSQANPSLLNQVLEGMAGKIKTAQKLSIENQEVTNSAIRKGLGIAEDAPLTVDSLQKVRQEAGAAYERIRDSGNVVADPNYTKALDALAEPYLRAAKDFPKAAQTEVMNAIEAARVPSFDASSAVDQISILRKDADKAYRNGDSKLGGTYKGIANAMEDQLGRHLEHSIQPSVTVKANGNGVVASSGVGRVGGNVENGVLKIGGADIPESANRGKGYGTAMYEELARYAQGRGLRLASDETVEMPAVRVYEKLGTLGYDVKRNPRAKETVVDGERVLYAPKGESVFEVSGAPTSAPMTADALADFQNARRMIAQTYTVQKHLKTDGNVDAVGLARELKRKPLTGELKTVAEFGQQFPKAAQMPERIGGVNAISPLDLGVGGIVSAAAHSPAYLALLGVRPAIRSAIISKMYQDNMVNAPSYGPSAATRLQAILGDSQRNPLVPVTEMAEGQRN